MFIDFSPLILFRQCYFNGCDADCGDDVDSLNGLLNLAVAVAAIVACEPDVVAAAVNHHLLDLNYCVHGAINEHRHQPIVANYIHLVNRDCLVDHVDSKK